MPISVMKWEYIFVFFIGFFSCAFLFFAFNSQSIEVPFSGLAVSGFGIHGLGFEAVNAPGNHIKESNIIVLGDRVILRVKGATLSNYVDSGSMIPVLDKGANGIRIVPDSENDIDVGDIISFRVGGILVVHRVIEKGVDNEGGYFIVKGDANSVDDGKIRFKDIKYVTIGIIY